MKAKKAKPTGKDFELLAEQAQQARTQFFVYLATSAYLLVTVMSITDKQLLLNNSLITLPLLNIGVPPLFVLIIGPLLLVLTYCNLHIHWFRYVKEVEELNFSTEKARRKLFPIMIYQALYHPKEGFMGVLENSLAEVALFGLLVPIQTCFFLKILKIQAFVWSELGFVFPIVSVALTLYWLYKSTHQSTIFNGAKKIMDRSVTYLSQDPKNFIGLETLAYVYGCIYTVVLAAVFASFAHLEVPYDVLSPSLELISTPIVAPFLERMESPKEAQKMQAKHVFEGVYWLDLKDRSLKSANLENTILLKTNLSGADLSYANLQGTNFEQANLEGVNLEHVNLRSANLQDARLSSISLQDASIFSFIRQQRLVPLAGGTVTLQDVFLGYANLISIILERGNLQYANLNCGGFSICTNLKHADLEGTNLQHADLRFAELQHADLGGAKLQNAYLILSNLQYANLEGVQLQHSDLSGANLRDVYFKTRRDEKTGKDVPVYKTKGETLCDAKTLAGARMDDWLFKKLKTLKACKGKLEGVNDPNYKVSP